MLNLNRNPAYTDLRQRRVALHAKGKPVTGMALAPALTQYSERRQAYVYDIERIIRGNRLEDFDHLELAENRPVIARTHLKTTTADQTAVTP